jgi:tetratricopeptide (TPR) repeat protein
VHSIKKDFLYKTVVHILLIAAIGFFAYSNTFQAPFQWDEEAFLGENPIIRNLNYFIHPLQAAKLPFYDAFSGRYIGYLTFAMNYKLHGFNVLGFHIVNLSIHIINAVLVYFFILVTFRTPYLETKGQGSGVKVNETEADYSLAPCTLTPDPKLLAFFTALLFVSHPLQTEAVTYIFQRFASLVTLFYLLSVVSYAYSRITVNVKRKYVLYALSILSAVAAMKTKENAFTLPVIIVLYEFCFFSPSPRVSASQYPRVSLSSRLFYLAPLLLTLFIIPLTIVGTNKPLQQIMHQVATADVGYANIQRWPYLFTQFRVIVTYLRLLVLPVNQNLDYDYHLYKSFFDPQVFLSFLFLAALFGLGMYLVALGKRNESGNRGIGESGKSLLHRFVFFTGSPIHRFTDSPILRLVGFGILWFFITLSVESSIIPIPVLIDEYRIYLPSVGFFIAVIAALSMFARKIKLESRMMLLLFCLIIAALFGLTYVRNAVWFERFTLWEDVVKKSPNNARGYNNLGTGYLGINDPDKAIKMFDKAISLQPYFMSAYLNRGVAYFKKEDYDQALKDFFKADSLQKNYLTYIGIGKVYFAKGELKLGLKNFILALFMKPDSEKALSGVAFYYAKTGDYKEAFRLYGRALELNPSNPDIYLNRGKVYMVRKEYAKAASDFAAAVRLNPTDIDAVYNCAMAYYQAGQFDSAIREYSRAIAMNAKSAVFYKLSSEDIIRPPSQITVSSKSPVLYEGRGLSFYSKKDMGRAIEDFTKAIELYPEYALAYSNRGLAWSAIKRFDLAIKDFTRAIEIKPDFAVAYMNRGVAYKVTGSVKQALADFDKALSLDRDLAVVYTNRGDLYFEAGKRVKAVRDFERGCALKDINACERLKQSHRS